MKLKKKLAYKSNYMYNFIRKDVVAGAIKWLKENNQLYGDIELNNEWADEWISSEFAEFLNEAERTEDNVIGETNTYSSPGMVHSDTASPNAPTNTPEDGPVNGENIPAQSGLRPCSSDTGMDTCAMDDSANASTCKSPDEILEEKELLEDEAAALLSLSTVGPPRANVLEYENLGDEIYSCAPGENNTPRYMLLDDDFEVLAFPDLFPYGTGGFSKTFRKTKLTMRKYFQQRLLNVDGRFANNIEYLFCAQYATEINQIQGDTNIALSMKRGRTMDGEAVTAGMLRNPELINRLVNTQQAYKFLRNVRGSPAYWQHEMYELLAMLRALGIPTWFLTLSAADLHWTEMIEAVSIHNKRRLSRKQIKRMSIKERSEYLKLNPVTSVIMFQYRVEQFFSKYLVDIANPVGKVKEYVIKIEFQERGSPHAHCLLWVDGAPRIDVDPDEHVCRFIDEYVTGVIPHGSDDTKYLAKLVKKYETHSHSSYCRRNHSCRFGFPKAPSESDDDVRTAILTQSTEILARIYDVIDNMPDIETMDEVLTHACVSEEDYINALKITKRGRSVILKRDPGDAFTNGYNFSILLLWGANIDFQFILDEYSMVMYICAYVMKSERAMGEVLKAVARECQSEPIEEQLRKIGKAFVGNRVLGGPETGMRELSMWLMKKSRKVTYVDSNMRDNRVCLPKSSNALENMDADDDNIYMTSVHDRYAARPNSLANMCLAKFAVAYEPIYGKKSDACTEVESNDDNDSNDDDDGRDANAPCLVKLSGNLGYMRKRKKDSILRVRSYRQSDEPENYYHSRLILYYPWSKEDDLIGTCDTFADRYAQVSEIVEHNAHQFHLQNTNLDAAIDNMAENGPPEILWDSIAPGTEQENAAAADDDTVMIRNIDDDDNEINDLDVAGPSARNTSNDSTDSRKDNSLGSLYAKEARKNVMCNAEYRSNMRQLNEQQREIVMYNRRWCKQYVHSMRSGKQIPGFRVFLGGPGGCGKSHVINMIRRDTIYFLQQTMNLSPDEPIVLLTAPTGLAAFNIGGITIHAAFNFSSQSQGKNTNWERQAIMQLKLGNVILLIIDEISMVGLSTFRHICETLKHVKQTRQEWGGICVLVVGDFYQLPPIGDSPVYRKPQRICKPEDMAPLLWDEFLVHELTQVMRQSDVEFATALNSIRRCPPEVGSYEDQMLQSRELLVDNSHPDYPREAMHVYAQNQHCSLWNDIRLDSLPGVMHTSVAKDIVKDNVIDISKLTLSDNLRNTGSLPQTLNVKVGARVMLTINIDVSDGLSNGAMGTVTDVITNGSTLHAVLVQFDSDKIGKDAQAASKYRHVNDTSVPIFKKEATFSADKRRNHNRHVRISRTQFPLVLCWAITIHKCQGMTLPEIVVDMDPKKGKFNNGQAYVAFSRVTALDKLHILNYNREQIRTSSTVSDAMCVMSERQLPNLRVPIPLHSDHSSNIMVCHLNICDMSSRVCDVNADKLLHKADIISFNETHLQPSSSITADVLGFDNNYVMYRCDRTGRGGGVALVVNQRLQPRHILTTSLLEIVIAQVTVNNQLVVLMSVYRPPAYSVKQWIHEMNRTLDIFRGSRICVIGDFNEDIDVHDSTDSKCTPIHTFFSNLGYDQHVKEPTRDSGTLIDHVYTSNINGVECHVVDCYYSDHDIVSCILDGMS